MNIENEIEELKKRVKELEDMPKGTVENHIHPEYEEVMKKFLLAMKGKKKLLLK